MKAILYLAILTPTILASSVQSPPEWPKAYSVKGFLILPFAEIMEPFHGYIDYESGNSRIDYYNGMDKTYQLSHKGKFGSLLKVKAAIHLLKTKLISDYKVSKIKVMFVPCD